MNIKQTIKAVAVAILSAIAIFVAGCESSCYKLHAEKVEPKDDARFCIKAIEYHAEGTDDRETANIDASAVRAAITADRLEGLAARDGSSNEVMPLDVEVRADKLERTTYMSFWALSLGVVPGFTMRTANYHVYVWSPSGQMTKGSFSIEKKLWTGWLPIVLPYPSFDVDRRGSLTEDYDFIPGDLVACGIARKTLELASAFDYVAYVEEQKKISKISLEADLARLADMQEDKSANVAAKARERYNQVKQFILEQIPASRDVEWLSYLAGTSPEKAVAKAAENRIVELRLKSVKETYDIAELEKIMTEERYAPVRNAAQQKWQRLCEARIQGMDDIAELEKIMTEERYAPVRNAIQQKWQQLAKERIRSMDDIGELERIASDKSDGKAEVAEAAERWIVFLRLTTVEKTDDIAELEKMMIEDRREPVRNAAQQKWQKLAIERIQGLEDMGELERLADDNAEADGKAAVAEVAKNRIIKLRLKSVAETDDIAELQKTMEEDCYAPVRDAAHQKWQKLWIERIRSMEDRGELERIAADKSNGNLAVAKAAENRIIELRLGAVNDIAELEKIMKEEHYEPVRAAALERVKQSLNASDIAELAKIMNESTCPEIRSAVNEKLWSKIANISREETLSRLITQYHDTEIANIAKYKIEQINQIKQFDCTYLSHVRTLSDVPDIERELYRTVAKKVVRTCKSSGINDELMIRAKVEECIGGVQRELGMLLWQCDGPAQQTILLQQTMNAVDTFL